MSTQTGRQMHCRETGKAKNCIRWAEYEEGFSGSAAMCNGGIFDGDSYDACPSRPECQAATYREQQQAEGRRMLPIAQQSGGTRLVGATPAAQQQQQQTRDWRDDFYARSSLTMRQQQPGQALAQARVVQPGQQGGMAQYQGVPYPTHSPTPVQPPQQYPQAMQTPFAAPVPFHTGGISPTFIPEGDEGIFSRLMKNVGQGMIASTGWHVFDYARNVDMFGRRR